MLDEEKMSQAANILKKRRSAGTLTGDWQCVVTVDFAGYLLSFSLCVIWSSAPELLA